MIETAMFVNDGIATFDCLWNKISHDCNPDSYVIIKSFAEVFQTLGSKQLCHKNVTKLPPAVSRLHICDSDTFLRSLN